jgi:phosphoglycerol transferase MdoB-like AlkP superfamily enzyme
MSHNMKATSKLGQQIVVWGEIFLIVFCLLLWPGSAWALQVHPAPEGLYAHQLAHLFFIASLGMFAYWLQSARLVRQRGWRLIQISCFLFILWNMDTFAIHWLEYSITREMFISSGLDWSSSLVLNGDWRNWAYYFGKFDHLLCVPAILFLLAGLRNLCHNEMNVRQLDND